MPVPSVASSGLSGGRHRGEQLLVLGLPLHGPVDAVPAAGVVVEEHLLQGRRAHLAVFGQVQRRLGEAVRLAARTQIFMVEPLMGWIQ